VHSSTNETPNERWHNEYCNVQMLEENFVNECFLHRVNRKVRKDSTIKIDNTFYDVPYRYVDTTIEVRYDPNDFSQIFIFENNKKCETCKIVDKVSNSKIKRKNTIDYSMATNDERNVIEMEEN
jgi:hypothetical protein